MNAGFRPSTRVLILAVGASVSLHLAVLFSVGLQPPRQAKIHSAIVSRLVPSPGQSVATPSPTLRSETTPPPPRSRKRPIPAAPVREPPALPAILPVAPPSGTPDLPLDMRVREVVVTSPSIFGLPEKYPADEGELPYAWSDDIDRPPQATSMSRTQYPPGADGDSLVLVRARVGQSGAIEDFEVLCGAEPFEDVARQSVPSWVFVPPTRQGGPARAWLLLEFAFMKRNAEEGFDPSLADVALATMRAACAETLAAARR